MELLELLNSFDYRGIFAEYIIHHSLDKFVEQYNLKFKGMTKQNIITEKIIRDEQDIYVHGISISINKNTFENNLVQLVTDAYNRTNTIEVDSTKSLLMSYVETDFFPSQKRMQVEKNKLKRISTSDIFSEYFGHMIIVGDLGSGKTTLVKKLCQDILKKDSKYFKNKQFPILILLRDLNRFTPVSKDLILFEYILQKLGLLFELDTTDDRERKSSIKSTSYFLNLKRLICDFLDQLNAIIFLDGFDEISNKRLQSALLEDIESMSTLMISSRLILTSRTSEYNYNISNTHLYEIAPLNESQIDIFISSYITSPDKAISFKNQLMSSPYFDTSKKPLALAHLCKLYEHNGSLPAKPKTVYKKIVALYIEDWDIARRVDRQKKGELLSAYNELPNDRKEEFISKIAYYLTTKTRSFVFTESDILKCYYKICDEFSLPILEAKLIVNEIENHSGLIMQTSNDTFEFSHPSIQEFLCADYISRSSYSDIPIESLVHIPNELAITIALSSEPNNSFFRLVFEYLGNNVTNINFINVFLDRLTIEKPDFKEEPRLGFIILHIYSMIKYKGDILINNFYPDNEIKQTLNAIIKLIESTESIKKSVKRVLLSFTEYENYQFRNDPGYINDSFTYLNRVNNILNVSENYQPIFLAVPNVLL